MGKILRSNFQSYGDAPRTVVQSRVLRKPTLYLPDVIDGKPDSLDGIVKGAVIVLNSFMLPATRVMVTAAIKDGDEARLALALSRCKDAVKATKVCFADEKKRRDHAHTEICDAEKGMLAPVNEFISEITAAIALIHAEARKKREAEVQAAIAKAKAEQAEKVDELVKAGNVTHAEMVEVLPPVVRLAPKQEMVATEKRGFEAVVVDFPAMVMAVASGTIPMDALQPNPKWLKKAGETGMPIPGCILEETSSFRVSKFKAAREEEKVLLETAVAARGDGWETK